MRLLVLLALVVFLLPAISAYADEYSDRLEREYQHEKQAQQVEEMRREQQRAADDRRIAEAQAQSTREHERFVRAMDYSDGVR